MWTSGNILPQQMVDTCILDAYKEDEECNNADSDMDRYEFEQADYESSVDESDDGESDNWAGIIFTLMLCK